jgi:hypothetical protein
MKGYFLAPKCYLYNTIEGTEVLKFKGMKLKADRAG